MNSIFTPPLSPKKSFMASEVVKAHQVLVVNDSLRHALEMALAQMAVSMPAAPDMASAASYHYRMEGAKQFIGIFLSLSDPETIPVATPRQNLNRA